MGCPLGQAVCQLVTPEPHMDIYPGKAQERATRVEAKEVLQHDQPRPGRAHGGSLRGIPREYGVGKPQHLLDVAEDNRFLFWGMPGVVPEKIQKGQKFSISRVNVTTGGNQSRSALRACEYGC